MKQVLLILAIVLTTAGVSAGPQQVQAQSSIQAVVRPYNLNVRATPTPDGAILGQYPHGTLLTITGREDTSGDGGTWVYAAPAEGGLTGWVRSDYLKFPAGVAVLALPVIAVPGAAPAPVENPPAAAPAGALAAVTAEPVNFRSGPELTYAVIRQLPGGMPVTLIGRNANGLWAKAVVDGQEGWLYTKLLRISGDKNALPVVEAAEQTAPSGAPQPGASIEGVVPPVGARARQIYLRGQSLGNRRSVFSKVGDSITESASFLVPVGVGGLQLGDYAYLQGAVNFFSQTPARTHNSFANTSLAARSGWTSSNLLDPASVFSDACQPGESPLVCEYRATRPSVALIMIGTNDVNNGVDSASFRANLEAIVQTSIDRGVIPVLSTIPDNFRQPELQPRVGAFNAIIVSVAGAYGIPLWNYWQALQNLPNKGLSGDGYHPSVDPATGETAVFTADGLQYGYTMRNLTALMVLDAIWRGALY